MSGVRGIKVALNANKEEELAAIVDIPQTGWFLLARQPSSEAFAPVTNTLRNTLLITLLLSIPLLALLLAALNRLLQPFADLAGQLHEMAEGTRPMEPVATHATDEVADVADSFNRLQGKLLEQEQRLIEMAHHDNLTGLPNRLTIMGRLENELLRCQRTNQGLALLFLDLDGFKPVNDDYGHQVGDILLREIAVRLSKCVRDIDTVARLGGDEFLILLSSTEAPQEAAERVARECINALAVPIRIGDLSISVGVSIGIATSDSQCETAVSAAQLVSQADIAMYQAKADGRNRYTIHPATHPPHTKQ
jgi:diguanylate cyclase (GGDEF)-like protein